MYLSASLISCADRSHKNIPSYRYLYLLLIFAISIFSYTSLFAAEYHPLQSVIKIKTYQPKTDGSYIFSSYGSAIAISSSRVLTNAHVILGVDGEPTFRYEICVSNDFRMAPRCLSSARLIAIDTVTDLALLEFSPISTLSPVIFSQLYPNIGDTVSTYGYPQIGGDTITRTEGKVAGYDRMMYKIDGGIDHGNSGGGAFDSSGNLIGMPTAVASDNSSIGYIIPTSRLNDFLHERSPFYRKVDSPSDPGFIRYLRKNQFQSSQGTYDILSTSLKNPRIIGLTTKTKIVSHDGTMAYLEFSDRYDILHARFSCTDDQGVSPTWQIRRDGILQEQSDYPDWQIGTLDTPDYFIVSMDHATDDAIRTMYYKKYPACFVEITTKNDTQNIKNLDRVITFFQKALQPKITSSRKEMPGSIPYFSRSIEQSSIRTIRSIDAAGEISTILGVKYRDTWIYGMIDGQEFSNRSGLDDALGTTDIVSWDKYIQKFTPGLDQYRVVDLGQGQSGILSSSYDADKKVTRIVFRYIYQIADSRYAYWDWIATVPGNTHPDLGDIAQVFTQMKYPGSGWIGK